MEERTCPNCGSKNISYQRETVATIGGGKSYYSTGKKHHSLTYWIFIGWLIFAFKLIFKLIAALFTFGLSTLGKKNKGATGTHINASKNINRTIAVCQGCGNSWKI